MWFISKKTKTPEQKMAIPYKYCLNCGTELNGKYCHECGQQALSPTPKVKDFILEYLNNAFIWDTKLFITIWNLIRKPGFLTNEFNAGKFVSYENPLKLNMFMLFVFITLFLLFSDTNKIYNLTTDEMVLPSLSIGLVMEIEEYARKIELSPKDTVELLAPLDVTTNYPGTITCLEVITDTQGKSLDRWIAVIPSILIEDQLIIRNDNGIYQFNANSSFMEDQLHITLMSNVWKEMVAFTTKYFPMIVLFTAPLLSLAISIVHFRQRRPFIHHFIFALHYIALLELLMTSIYILYLFQTPLNSYLQWIMIVGSTVYLAVAVRRVYNSGSWPRSIIKTLIISLTYLLIGLMTFFGIFIISCIIEGFQAG